MNIDELGTLLGLSAVTLTLGAVILGLLWWKPWLTVGASLLVGAFVILFAWDPDLVGGESMAWFGAIGAGIVLALAGVLAVPIGLAARPRAADPRRWRAFARNGALIAVALVAAHVASRSTIGGLTPGARLAAFDAATWRANRMVKGSAVSDRVRMLHDLVHRVLPGRVQADIAAMLGADGSGGGGSPELWYSISPTADEFLGASFLVIAFDESGRYRAAWIAVD